MDEQLKTEKDAAIEAKRAMLRNALKKNPNDERIQKGLKQLLQPYYVQRAAKLGVFVCYSRDDELFALDLTTDLRDKGVNVFMDEMDIDDDVNMEWGDVVGNALRKCGVLLLVLSPDGLHDAEVQGERIYFLKNGKVVIPVTARTCKTNGLEMIIPPLDFEHDYQGSLAKLVRLLVHSEEASAD
jgi:hypothetical protein